MQGFGFGRYRPPDADPRKEPFNAAHPLGKRARHLSTTGALIVRFELPFNIWCGGCNNHIGQGVRYNAHKNHVGDYHSTKIWGFRCKCHICSSWFEIRTDPQHARYIVHEGAREQNREWDPEQNGGHPIYDTESSGDQAAPGLAGSSSAAPAPAQSDPFATLEKHQTERAKAKQRAQRVDELHSLSERRNTDPYTLNSKLRSHFRTEKRKRTDQLEKDLDLKRRIGWHPNAPLASLSPASESRASAKWSQLQLQRDRSRLQSKSESGSASGAYAASSLATHSASKQRKPADSLRDRVLANSKAKSDPFLSHIRTSLSSDKPRK
ncbi:DUF572-domain-containing protein [Testicularia cyperi]|uniref:DUF572-domain-containing protein n=1 Tax=Testicularia cyperi TaxID=1882483 RepID=A0A317XMW5_9BASI|nr:DUF572-domain-containing protein [Testicularia cyperi]